MRELTPDTITDSVLEQMAETPHPHLKTIIAAAVRHLHACAGEVKHTSVAGICPIERPLRADRSAILKHAERGAASAGAG